MCIFLSLGSSIALYIPQVFPFPRPTPRHGNTPFFTMEEWPQHKNHLLLQENFREFFQCGCSVESLQNIYCLFPSLNKISLGWISFFSFLLYERTKMCGCGCFSIGSMCWRKTNIFSRPQVESSLVLYTGLDSILQKYSKKRQSIEKRVKMKKKKKKKTFVIFQQNVWHLVKLVCDACKK